MYEELRNWVDNDGSATGSLVAIIIKDGQQSPGVTFFTPPDLSLQVGYSNLKAGKEISPHVHRQINREVKYTQEFLYIKIGKLRAKFYSEAGVMLHERVLQAGDAMLLISGGHGFEVIEDLEMLEVKQGPYGGQKADKLALTAKG